MTNDASVLSVTLADSLLFEARLNDAFGRDGGRAEEIAKTNEFDQVGKVGQVQTCKNPIKHGCWSTLPTWSTFLTNSILALFEVLFGGPKRQRVVLRN